MLISVGPPPQTIVYYSKFSLHQVWEIQDDQLKERFQLMPIYFQLIFLYNLTEI